MIITMAKKILRLLLCIGFVCFSFIPCTKIYAFENTVLDNISATFAIVIDRDTNQILAEKDADAKMYPASMTKMMTAIIAIENLTDLNQQITITQDMIAGLIEQNASLAGFKVGDTPTVQDILYGIALPSGADATNAAAFTISGSIEAYVDLMNEKAQAIGMTNTHFVNTTGLHDENHYSTARDMAKLLQYCLNNDTFKTIFSTHTYTTSPLASSPLGIELNSTIFTAAQKNGYALPGLIGGKTGFTYPAGHCLASWEDINDMHLITVVANADAYAPASPHVKDTDSILNQLQSWNRIATLSTQSVVSTVKVKHIFAEEDTIEVKSPIDFNYDLPQDIQPEVTCTLPQTISSANTSQNLEGVLTISCNGEIFYTTKLMVKIPEESHLLDRIALWFQKVF